MKKLATFIVVTIFPLFAFAYAHSGTIVGTPTFPAGKFDLAIAGTSDSNYISLPSSAINITTSSSWTVEAWLKTTSASGAQVAVSFGTSATANMWIGVSAGKFAASIYGTGGFASGAVLSSTVSIDDGNWHQCAMVMTSGTSVTLFVDGVASGTFTGTINAVSGVGAIGRFSQAPTFSWSGSVDEVAIWSVAEYTSNFTPPTSPYTGNEANLVSLYHLDANAADYAGLIETAPNNAGITYSPYNWNVSGTSANTINSGAYLRTVFSGTTIGAVFNTANSASPYSEIWVRIDGDGWTEYTLAANNPMLIFGSALQNRKHLLELIVKSTSETLTRWAANSQTMIQISSFVTDPSATFTATLSRSKSILIYGDSITEGVRTVDNTAPLDTDGNDVLSDYSYALATATDAEVGIVGFGATGINTAGSGGVPDLQTSYDLIYSGVTRTFTPCPDLVIYNEGTNDTGSITTGFEVVVNGILAACPNARQLLLVPFDGTHASEIAAVITAINNPKVTSQSTTGWFNTADSSDGVHPYGYEHLDYIAPKLFPIVAQLLNGTTTGSFTGR